MKKKYYLTATMFLLMALVMAAQPMSKQRACDVVKMDLQKGKTFTMYANKNVSETQQQGSFRLYTSQQSPRLNENESTDSATVTLLYENFSEEVFATNRVRAIMMYNCDWSAKWQPGTYTPDGTPVIGIIVTVPLGTYDIYTATMNMNNGADYFQIKELVTVEKDTTIYLDVLNCPNQFSYELYNVNNELLHPSIVRPLEEEPWEEVVEEGNINGSNGRALLMLEDYGSVLNMEFYANDGVVVDGFGSGNTYGLEYFNNLSDRYQFVVIDNTEDKNGILYVNRLISNASNGFPLINSISDYVNYEETIQGTPKGLETVENPCVGLQVTTFIDNSDEYGNTLPGHTPVSDDRLAKVLINANKNEGDNLIGVNVAVKLSIIDYEKWIVEDGISMHEYAVTEGPKVMVNKNRSLEFLVNSDVAKTPEVNVWKDDYPPHPKFSYTFEQKKEIVGNCCPILAITSKNNWYRNANRINMYNQHLGRHEESFGAGDLYSTMTAKYNSEEIWNGKQALDSLSRAWWREKQPDGTYEFEFTNANVAVDGIPGKNVTTVYFDQTKEDWNSPVLKMLQFRDAENNVTDRFINPNEGTIMFAGGDFDPRSTTYIDDNGYERTWEYEDCQPMTVEVSYAPYGSEDWQPLEGIEHQSEFDDIPGMGFFYSGSLASVSVPSENKWYDLKFRLVDESGNWQEQIVSPAFKIESLVPEAITEVINGDATEVARYSVDGRRITSPEPGINIVEMSDGTTHKVLVK